MGGQQQTRQDLVRVLAFSLAVLFVVFLVQVDFHSHVTGHNEATCQVCQATHLASVPNAGSSSLITPLLSAEDVQPFVPAFHQELSCDGSPSRAPPTS